jgi:hypothetical protein
LVDPTKNHEPDRFQSVRATLWVQLKPCCSRRSADVFDHTLSLAGVF